MKNQWFKTLFKNHCCKIPDKTWVFVRINWNFSGQEKTEFSARKTLFGRNDFNEMTVMAEIMQLLNEGQSEVEITHKKRLKHEGIAEYLVSLAKIWELIVWRLCTRLTWNCQWMLPLCLPVY